MRSVQYRQARARVETITSRGQVVGRQREKDSARKVGECADNEELHTLRLNYPAHQPLPRGTQSTWTEESTKRWPTHGSQHPAFGQGYRAAVADNQVIQHAHSDQGERLDDSCRQQAVGLTGFCKA